MPPNEKNISMGLLALLQSAYVSAVLETSCRYGGELLKRSPTKQTIEYWHPNTVDWAHRPGSGWKGWEEVGSTFSGWKPYAEEKKNIRFG